MFFYMGIDINSISASFYKTLETGEICLHLPQVATFTFKYHVQAIGIVLV